MKIRIEISEQNDDEIVIKCRQKNDKIAAIESAIENALGSSGELVLCIGSTEYYIQKSDILFFESSGGKVFAHTKDGMFTTHYRLFELEDIMPSSFVRISKSVIANILLISSLRRELTGNGEITFRGCDKKIYFSRAYYKILKDKIEEMRFGS